MEFEENGNTLNQKKPYRPVDLKLKTISLETTNILTLVMMIISLQCEILNS